MKADKFTKAKVKLILDHPFYACLALKMKYVEDTSIPTACTNGKQIRYNPKFVEGLTLDEACGVIAHEVSHNALLHHTRRQGRELRKFNVAADYAVNPLLIQSGLKLPKGARDDPQFHNKSAEEIYNLLPDMPGDDGSGDGNDPGGCGGVEDSGATTQSEIDQMEAEMKQDLAQAATVAKQQGKLPDHLKRLVDEILAPKVPWKEVLQRFLCQIAHNDYTWTKPSRRFLAQRLYLPSLESIETGEIVLMVDTSGSIDVVLLNQFAAEIQDIASTFGTGFKIIYCDADVAGVQDIEKDEMIDLKPEGGGGTDFKPPFDYLEKEGIEPCAAVYFTDGCCNSFPKDPGFPVLWALHDNKNFEAPFGEYVHL